MNTATNPAVPVEEQLAALTERIDLVLERQRAISELVSESGPVLRAMMDAGTERLDDLEKRGYFAAGRSMMRLVDRVVESYSAEDVDALGDSIVSILDTVRNVTQSDVLSIANDATDVLHNAADLEPVGVMGAMRTARDEDVQRGIAVMLEVLKQVGKAAAKSERTPARRRLNAMLAPRSGRVATPPRRRPAQPAPKAAPAPVRAVPCPFVVPGFDVDEGGYLVDPSAWTEAYAATMAEQLGVELSDEAWQVLNTMRATFLDAGQTPNLRKIAKTSGVATRSIYQIFKKAPGTTAARIAGVPKPVGCI